MTWIAVSPSKERLATAIWRAAAVSLSRERLATAIWRVADLTNLTEAVPQLLSEYVKLSTLLLLSGDDSLQA